MLTARQAQVVALYASGYNAYAISRMEFLSVHTVRGHLADVRERLGAKSLCNAIALAQLRGFIEWDGEIGTFVAVDQHRVALEAAA